MKEASTGKGGLAGRRDLSETTLSEEIVYEGKFLRVRRDLARTPDGAESVREYILHPGAAAMVPFDAEGRILVEWQFRYPRREHFIEIPAGKLDPGESFLDAARRELVEETGYAATEWAPLTTIHPAIGFADERIDIFLCRGLVRGTPQLDHGEVVDCEFVTLGWLVDELRAGRLTDVKTQIAVHWVERIVSGAWPWPAFEHYPAE